MYGIRTKYVTNVFGADEHYVVILLKRNSEGEYKRVNSWSYSTQLTPRLGHARAERRIVKLRKVYDAVLLDD